MRKGMQHVHVKLKMSSWYTLEIGKIKKRIYKCCASEGTVSSMICIYYIFHYRFTLNFKECVYLNIFFPNNPIFWVFIAYKSCIRLSNSTKETPIFSLKGAIARCDQLLNSLLHLHFSYGVSHNRFHTWWLNQWWVVHQRKETPLYTSLNGCRGFL